MASQVIAQHIMGLDNYYADNELNLRYTYFIYVGSYGRSHKKVDSCYAVIPYSIRYHYSIQLLQLND